MTEANAAIATTGTMKPEDWDRLNVDITHSGRVIILPGEPGNMPLEKAVEALQRKIADENQPFNVFETIDAYPHDAAVAFVKAMNKLYGFTSSVSTWFQNPTMLTVKTGPLPEDVVQCPMGIFKLPGIDENIFTRMDSNDDGTPFFQIGATVKKKDRHLLLELAAETRRIVKAESIYRGKPIRLGVDEEGDLMLETPPEFLDVSEMTEESVLFDEHTSDQINVNILVPLRETERCRRERIPLKRGNLLEGPFGTGKSLLARLVARVAEQNGWTFILLDRVQGLRVALEFANRYSPAVVFAEDIDRIAGERDDETEDLINIIDGVVSKRAEIMTVLTTNFVEKIDPVLLRPGRLDAVISIRAPGPKTVERLLRHYAGALIAADTDLTNAGTALDGQIPASIRECVERAKLAMIGRGASTLSDSDLVVTAETMKNHLALLNREQATTTDAEQLAKSLRAVVGGVASGEGGTDIDPAMIDRINQTVAAVLGKTRLLEKGLALSAATLSAVAKKADVIERAVTNGKR